ncbi:MAG TPA: NCS2 family permease [Rhizomicrobium sp.]|jgi:AGZA family xanthine/uracil permease-like MFS transporter|nr:NCS2 family permease [Rhizomicrobium sp.]
MFDLTGAGMRREIAAGFTTFLTLAYIMFVNPRILAAAGMNEGAVFVATCLASAITTALMGFYARLPVALAPGMGLNAYFAFSVVPALGGDWRLALGCVFLSGVLFVILSLTPAREWLINAIPKSLKLAIAAGIGFFLALIGFVNAGAIAASPATLIQEGALTDPKVLIAAGALVLMFALAARGIAGAVLIGIVAATIAAMALGLQPIPPVIVSLPPSLAPTLLQFHFGGAAVGLIATGVFVFLLIDMLDTSGTLTAVAHQAGLLDRDGHLPNARRALATDAMGTMIGAALGTSPVTAYIESATGIQAGGRTGLTALVVAALFLVSLFFAPLAAAVPAYATAPALIFVAALMAKGLKEIEWDDPTEAAPALLTALAIPFTYSIAAGMGIGFIAYAAIKIVSGRYRDVNAAVAVIALAFVAKIVLT